MAATTSSHYDPIVGKGGSSITAHDDIPEDFLIGTSVATSGGAVRAGFIRRVYGILAMQLALTTFISALFMLVKPLRDGLLATGAVLQIVLFIATIGTLIGTMINRNSSPANMMWLGAFTVAESLMVGYICAAYQANGLGYLVLEALAITLTVFACLTAYALISKKDFSFMGGALFAGLCVLLLASFANLFFGFLAGGRNPLLQMAIAGGGALLFSLYILYDTSLIIHHYGPDDYIIAAIQLYLDLINLFLYILQLLSAAQRD